MKYMIFGAGGIGTEALTILKKDNVECYIDNDIQKQDKLFNGLKVYSLVDVIPIVNQYTVVIAVGDSYINQIKEQLDANNIQNYTILNQIKYEITRQKILSRKDYISLYNSAIQWILKNSIEGKGIINNSELREAYPEVTGYYIPTLIRWGYKELAIKYAKWLCSIQHEDGSWYDTLGDRPYIFDSAQIIKGLIAVRKYCVNIDQYIIKGCDWILTNMTDEGRLFCPYNDLWGDGKTYSELIYTYCISPIYDAGVIFDRKDYIEKADKIKKYYTVKFEDKIINFNLLSHFYAYVIEAMIDIDRKDLAEHAMRNMEKFQKKSGAVPAYNNVDWVCSTGMFQLALIWYRLGNKERGDKAFQYACKLQNETGGWFGSYLSEDNENETNTYFPSQEISWANKYFLDALYYKNKLQFELQAPIFRGEIDKEDGRYKCIYNVVAKTKCGSKILDVGCGKGRYLKRLVEDLHDREYFGVDISRTGIDAIELSNIEKSLGTLTSIPYDDNTFDVVYTCEALEHAVDIESSISEMSRTTKSGGYMVVLDKNKEKLGYYDIEEWEQWFSEDELKKIMLKYCSEVDVIKNISFDNIPANGLFYCWVGKVEKCK